MENPHAIVRSVVDFHFRSFPRTRSGKGWFIMFPVFLDEMVRKTISFLFVQYHNPTTGGNLFFALLRTLQSRGGRPQSQQGLAQVIGQELSRFADKEFVEHAENRASTKMISAIKDNSDLHAMARVIPHEAAMNLAVDSAVSLLFGDEDIEMLLDRRKLIDGITYALLDSRLINNDQDRALFIARRVAPLVPCAAR